MQSGCALSLWARGKRNALDVAKALGYKENDEKSIYERLCKESARNIVSAQFRIKDVSKYHVIFKNKFKIPSHFF